MDLTTLFVVAAPGILLTAGLWIAARHTQRRIEASRDWPSVLGRIVSSRIRRARNSRWPEVRYVYEVRGLRHEGRRLAFVQHSRSVAECEAVIARYPPGAEIEVWYDPLKPGSCVLQREGEVSALRVAAAICGGVFLLVIIILGVQS